jgi:hypothetical protein
MFQMRARYDKVHFTVSCGSESHRAVLSIDGLVESDSHSLEEEQVIELLGGEGSNCSKVSKMYKVALEAYRIQIGLADPKNLKPVSVDSYWRSASICSVCNTRYGSHSVNTLRHFGSVEHLAGVAGLSREVGIIKRLVNWFERNTFENPEGKYRPIRKVEEFNSYTNSNRFGYINRADLLTTRFIDLAAHFTTLDLNNVTRLRKVSTVDRLSYFIEKLGEARIARIRRKLVTRAHPNGFLTFLTANRMVDERTMVEFMEAGIYANIYTYAKHGATAHQATRVYNATNGEKTLKQYLLEGYSPLDAVIHAETVNR